MSHPSTADLVQEFYNKGGKVKQIPSSPVQAKIQEIHKGLTRQGNPGGCIVTIAPFTESSDTINVLCVTENFEDLEKHLKRGKTYAFHFRAVASLGTDRPRINLTQQKNPETKVGFVCEILPTLISPTPKKKRSPKLR